MRHHATKSRRSLAAIFVFGVSVIIFAQEAKDVAKKVLPSVVLITTQDSAGRPIGLGSGFFVRPDVIATNYHVVRSAAAASARIVNTDSVYPVTGIVASDESHDIVLLKLEKSQGNPLTMADLSQVEVGESVYVFGSPEGLQGSVSSGIVSSKGTRQIAGEDLLQITAPISPGSSGGPVVNGRGEVVGIASASLRGGQNLNFAVPAPYLALLIANIRSPGPLSGAIVASTTPTVGGKQFTKDGLVFDYSNGWSITDESNSDAQQLTLNRADSDAQIRIFAHRGKVDTPEKLAQAKKAFIDPYVKSVNDTFVQMGAKPESKPSKMKVGEVEAEGVQLRASLGGEPGEADVYWLPLTNRVVVLTFFGPDAALKRATATWDLVRNTIKIEPPQPKASPSPKGKP